MKCASVCNARERKRGEKEWIKREVEVCCGAVGTNSRVYLPSFSLSLELNSSTLLWFFFFSFSFLFSNHTLFSYSSAGFVFFRCFCPLCVSILFYLLFIFERIINFLLPFRIFLVVFGIVSLFFVQLLSRSVIVFFFLFWHCLLFSLLLLLL